MLSAKKKRRISIARGTFNKMKALAVEYSSIRSWNNFEIQINDNVTLPLHKLIISLVNILKIIAPLRLRSHDAGTF